jgi:outer membrane autotransporter protein
MKRLAISRKAIHRAIRAACFALFLLAAQREAAAQSLTAPFVINGSAVSTNANGTFTSPVGFYDGTNSYNTFSVGSGVTLNSTSTYGGVSVGQFHSVIGATTASFTNQGSLTLNTNSGSYNAVVVLNQGSTSTNVTNSGSIVSNASGSNSALYVSSTSGNITVNNTGTLSASNNFGNTPLLTVSTTGNITLTNNGTVNDSLSGQAFSGSTTTGSIQMTNNATINLGNNSEGLVAVTSSGPVTVVNNGTINGTSGERGIDVSNFQNNAGAVVVTNSGTISGVYLGINANQHGTTLTVTNSGTITNSTYGIEATADGTASSFQIRNSGSITSSNSGIYAFAPATVYNSGSITAPTAMHLPSGSSLTLAGRPIISGTIIGGSSAASTSTLTFDLAIPAANLAAAQAQLNTEIAAYDAQNGGNYTFTVDGLTFVVSNFDYTNIADDLTVEAAARLYRNTPGFYSEGLVLDTLPSGNAVAARILGALNNVPAAGVVNALSELSPKELEVFRNVAFDNNTFNVADVNNHLANLRDGLTGFDASQLTVRDAGMDPTLDQVRDHLLAYNPASTPGLVSDSTEVLGAFDAKDMKSAKVNTTPPDRWSSFIAGKVILADLSDNPNLQDSNYTTGAVTAGLDYRLDDRLTVGALLVYAHTDANLDDRNSAATVDSYSPGLYASYVDGPWYGNFLGAYTRNAYSEDREINLAGLGGDNHGATSGNQGSANLTGGYEFQRGAFKFGPVASLQYVHLAIDSIQEQGPTALDIQSQDQDSLRTLLGVEARFNANVGPVNLTPHASVSWQHEYLDNSRGITSAFDGAGGGSFSVQTDTPDRDSAFLDIGLDATISKSVTLFVDYQAQAAQSNFFAQSAQGGVKIGF